MQFFFVHQFRRWFSYVVHHRTIRGGDFVHHREGILSTIELCIPCPVRLSALSKCIKNYLNTKVVVKECVKIFTHSPNPQGGYYYFFLYFLIQKQKRGKANKKTSP
jgi:hypothetical protein